MDSYGDNPKLKITLESKRLWFGGILLVTLLTYYPVSKCQYIWDDDNYVTHNSTLRSLDGLKDIWLKPGAVPQYYPLVHTSFWIEYHLWGLNPLGFHLVNVLLHGLSAFILWMILVKLKVPGSGLIALVFAVHPVHVESVAWITERKNILSAVFYLASLLVYLRFNDQIFNSEKIKKSSWSLYLLSFFLYLGALLSKTVTCSLPVVLLIIMWWRGTSFSLKRISPLAPFFLVGLTLGLFTVFLEKSSVGATGVEWEITLSNRCIIAGKALWFYIRKIIWPADLVFIYPRWEVGNRTLTDWLFPLSFVVMLTLLYCLRQIKLFRSLLAALLLFSVSLFPALGFIDVYPMRYSFVADHFQYLASIPIISIVLAAFFLCFQTENRRYNQDQENPSKQKFSFLAYPTFSLIIVSTLAVLAWNRCKAFQNSETLWTDTLKKNPNAWIAHNNLGLIYEGKGRFSQAINHYSKAIDLKPDHAYAHNNIAMTWEKLGNVELAEKYFFKALEIKPKDRKILTNCGNFMARRGLRNEALKYYLRALEINPNALDTLINIGNLHAQSQHFDAALSFYSQAVALAPDNPDVHYNMANLFRDKKNYSQAIKHYRLAIENKPDFIKAQNNLARILKIEFKVK